MIKGSGRRGLGVQVYNMRISSWSREGGSNVLICEGGRRVFGDMVESKVVIYVEIYPRIVGERVDGGRMLDVIRV